MPAPQVIKQKPKTSLAASLAAWWHGVLRELTPGTRMALRWPWPLSKPWEQSRLDVSADGNGLSDELLITPVLRAIKEHNPGCRLIFHSRFPELFAKFPYTDEVRLIGSDTGDVLALGWGPLPPPPRPRVSLCGEGAGLLGLAPFELEPRWFSVSEKIRAVLENLPRPLFVVQPLTSPWMPNKHWPTANWRELIARLTEHGSVVEIGPAPALWEVEFEKNFVSFAGKASPAENASIIALADVFAGPDCFGMHLASVCRTPAVIVFGGSTTSDSVPYKRMVPLTTATPCAPCWLAEDCPHDLDCLRLIEPATVLAGMLRIARERGAASV